MNFEDLKKDLETKATTDLKAMEKKMYNLEREVELRRKDCNQLREKNAELLNEIKHAPPATIIPEDDKVAEIIRFLSRRCMAITKGTLCGFCSVQDYCRVESVQKLRILLDKLGMPGAHNL